MGSRLTLDLFTLRFLAQQSEALTGASLGHPGQGAPASQSLADLKPGGGKGHFQVNLFSRPTLRLQIYEPDQISRGKRFARVGLIW